MSTATNVAGWKGRMVNNMVGGHLINLAYYGLYMTGCTNWNIAHNTFYNEIANATVNYGPAYFTGGSNLSVVNNIFARRNTSTNTTFYGSSATIFDTLNYNVFYRPDTTSNFAYLGAYYTPTNLIGVGGHNLNSIYANPAFVNDTNLTVNNSCMAGTPLPFVTTDFYGTTRSITAPTIGADEFIKQTEDIAIEAITAPTAPVTAGIQDMTVRVKNQGTNTVTSFNVSYTNNGGTPVVYNWSGSLAPCDTVSVTFTGGNQINISAIHNIVVYTSAPNSLVDLNRDNDTLKTQILLPLNGTYTIGGVTANFTDPAQAAVALKAAGVTGPVVFNINPGTYNGQVLVEGPITGLNDTNTVTFEGNSAATRIINANVSQAAFLIRNTSYIRVRNLTINNTAPAGATGIAVVGTTTNTVGSGCSIVGNIVNLPNVGFNTGYGIIATGTTNGAGISNNWIDSLTIDSNTVNGGSYGITIYGNTTSASTLRNRGHKVRYNTVNNATLYGVYTYYIYNAVDVIGNNISMVAATPSTFNYGLYFYYNQNSAGSIPHRIIGNKVINANYMGMYLYYFRSPSGVPMQVYNNVVSGTARYGTTYAMYCYTAATTANINMYHNTILADNAAGGTAYGVLYYNTNGTIQNIRNNIFGVSTNTAGTAYPFYFSNSAAALNVNFNNYYNLTSTNLVYRNGVNYTAANYKAANAGGDSSFNFTPSFTNLNNPSLAEGCTRGFDLSASVPNDIVGNTRSTTPNLGAYEFVGTSNDISIEALVAPVAPITLGTQNVVVRVKNVGTSTINSFSLSHSVNNGTPNVYSWTGVLAACDTATITLSGANQITLGASANNVKVYTSSPNAGADPNRNNDTVSVTLFPPMSGNYVIGAAPSDYTTFTDAANAMGGRGISGPVVFNVKTGTYNESLTLNSVIGASATNTITFKSQANHVDSAILTWNSNTGNNYIVRFNNNANHYIFDKITLTQTGNNVTSYGITLAATASFDTIRNCKLNMPIYPTTTTYTSYSIYATGYTGTGLCIDNNIIDGSYYGAYIYGVSRTAPMKNIVVNGNTFNNFYYSSLYYFYYSTNSRITNNIYNVPSTSSGTMYSYYRYNDSAFKFTNNIYNGIIGRTQYMYLDYTLNSPSNKSLIANNQIKGDGNFYFYVGNTSSNNQDVVHNSFNLGSGYFYLYHNTLSNYRVMNNLFNATGTYAYYFSAAPNAANITSDYNLVNVPGATPYYAAAARSLPALRSTYLGIESNSINYRAAFTSSTNLTPNAADTAVWAINGRGNHLGYTLNDVNNVARPQTPAAGVPDLGAFEVTPTAVAPLATAIPATPVAGGTQVFLFGTDTVAKIVYDAFASVPSDVSVRQYTGIRHPQAAANQNYTNVYTDITANGFGGYLFDASLYYTNAQIGTNPSETNLRMARYNTIWNTYTGAGSFVDSINNYITATFVSDFGAFIGTDDLNPIPVKLTTFVGKANNKNADLMWQTASEKNARLFEVHASVDGKIFKQVGTVKANGNTNVTSTYNFTDVNALANNNKVYYKLKSVDVDGTFEWSNIVIVNTKDVNNANIEVYPNPFNNNVTVSLADNTPATIEVVSLQGVSVYNATTNSTNSFANVNLTQLTSGVYFIKVTQNGNTTVQKLVKQ
jgi:hypothetical protein